MGFAGKSAKEFFEILMLYGARRVIDVRLNNVSQLAGFTKKNDLVYFLKTIADIDYVHYVQLAPTKEMLDEYKKKKMDWDEYERRFLEILESRRIEEQLNPKDFTRACLLCSESDPEHCHRRLVSEYLKSHWKNIDVRHL
jgi:uncharacterized protein (DUF488 family)